MLDFFLVGVFTLISLTEVRGRPDGAHERACATLNPGHEFVEPQKTTLPYDLLIDEKRPYIDHKLTFTIYSLSNTTQVGGFMVQARDIDFKEILGTFVPTEGSVRVMDCLGGVNNTATHIDSSPKEHVSMVWLPPDGFKGQFRFYATVAKTREIFWVAVPSPVVEYVEMPV
uniref:Reelin domain-containing protein n=1 Tax=Clastoptera arizonana TaxID=38151 RepID=A0A1B6D1X6_9HEMI